MDEVRNKKILIVEDDRALRRVLLDKLMLSGYTVLEARNGEEGPVFLSPTQAPRVSPCRRIETWWAPPESGEDFDNSISTDTRDNY